MLPRRLLTFDEALRSNHVEALAAFAEYELSAGRDAAYTALVPTLGSSVVGPPEHTEADAPPLPGMPPSRRATPATPRTPTTLPSLAVAAVLVGLREANPSHPALRGTEAAEKCVRDLVNASSRLLVSPTDETAREAVRAALHALC